jgi:hypothetical protein
VTRLDECGAVVESACVSATSEGFVDITLTKVNQDRQDALQLTANGDICVDKPKAPILRWYEVNLQFCLVDPELLNIMTADPLVLNDAVDPLAVGWDTEVGSAELSFFALEFWVGTEDEGCDDGEVVYGYGLLPFMRQGMLSDLTFGNAVATFTVNAITKGNSQWGVGPYNVLINESGVNAGFPGPLLTAIGPKVHKRFFWTRLAPPEGVCGCQELPVVLSVLPTSGPAATLRTMTFPLDDEGVPLLPAVISWDDASPAEVVTSGTTATHTYVAGTYNPTFTPTSESSPTYTSPTVTVS